MKKKIFRRKSKNPKSFGPKKVSALPAFTALLKINKSKNYNESFAKNQLYFYLSGCKKFTRIFEPDLII